jgi:hypothetical protein
MPGKETARKTPSKRPVASNEFLTKLEMTCDDDDDNFNYVDSAIAAADANEDLDDLFKALAGGSIKSGKDDMVGIEHTVYSIGVHRGDFEFKYFLIVKAASLKDGREIEYSIGAPLCVILLFTLHERGQFPVNVVIRSKDVANGEMLYMERVADRAIPLTAETVTVKPDNVSNVTTDTDQAPF